METLITIVHLIACSFLVLIVLIQAGKGGGLGAGFGGATGGGVLGAGSAADFLTRMTAGAAAIFFATSLSLAYVSAHSGSKGLERRTQESQPGVTAEPTGDAEDEAAPAAEPGVDPAPDLEGLPAGEAAPEGEAEATEQDEPASPAE